MDKDHVSYAKPEIRDYGTLKELTAICQSSGTGDSIFKSNPGFTTSLGVPGSHSYCISS